MSPSLFMGGIRVQLAKRAVASNVLVHPFVGKGLEIGPVDFRRERAGVTLGNSPEPTDASDPEDVREGVADPGAAVVLAGDIIDAQLAR